jgi:hypothetical protein
VTSKDESIILCNFLEVASQLKFINMRKTTVRLTLLLLVVLFTNSTWGQNLSPHELFQINSTSNFLVDTSTLVDKGYKFQSKQYDEITKTTESRWYFQASTHSGEEVSSYLIKSVYSDHKVKTVFFLYNPYHYRDFIQNLKKSKYKFNGVQIIGNKSYNVFKKDKATFLTKEKQDAANHNIFEIIVQTE